MIGRRLSHYEIRAELGSGGMGKVYLAEDTRLDRKVALKILPAEWAQDPERLRRFGREAKAIAALNHPNIVTVYSVEEEGGIHFFTMELVEGEPLDRVTPARGLSLEAFLDLAVPLADAMAEAHERGIIHRDLKPANIMVDARGRPKILDFGLARRSAALPRAAQSSLPTAVMTEQGMVLGTYPYMSPEQAEGGEVSHRSDIFSLGIVFYEMVTGRRPFSGKTPMSLITSILRDEAPPVTDVRAGLPAGLGDLIARCLEKDPAQRPQSAAELRDLLEDLRSGGARVSPGEVPTDLRETVTPDGDGGPAPSAAPAAGWQKLGPGLKAALIVLLLVAGAVTLQLLAPWRDRRAAAPGVGVQTVALAVLPLKNLSRDPEQQYFVDGMTEALITDLSKIDALRVISPSSVMRYKDTDRRPNEIARELGVDTLVQGSVLREGDRVRITAQLIEAATERSRWGNSYERELTSVLALQAQVARALASEIAVELTPQEESSLAAAREVDPETYQAYLKGRYYLNQYTPEGVEKGLRALQEAIDRDPSEPLPWAGLAIAYSDIAHAPAAPLEFWARSKAAAERALELDEALPEAYAALGEVEMMHDWDYPAAERAFQKALGLKSSLARTHSHYAWLLYIYGRWDEAMAAFRRAREVDPLSPLHSGWLGWVYLWEGMLDEATAEAERALDLRPGFPMALCLLGFVYADQGRAEEAIAIQKQAVAISPVWTFGLGYAYAKAGRRDEALTVAEELQSAEHVWNTWGLAEIHAALGDHDEAFRWLEAAYEGRHSWMPWIHKASTLDALHGDPRFEDLVRRMGLSSLAGAGS